MKVHCFTADDSVGIKSVVDRNDGLVYLGRRPDAGFAGTWCHVGAHTTATHPEPATPGGGGVGDLLAVACTSARKPLPQLGKLVVLTQRSLYTHIGVLRSDRWLPVARPNGKYVHFVWVEVLAIVIDEPVNESALRVRVGVGGRAPLWFRQGGGSHFATIDSKTLPVEIALPAELREALWRRFFPDGTQPPLGKVNGMADRAAVRA